MTNSDIEENKEKKPYPWYVICFLSNEFCERFAYYGMRTILIIYLTALGFDDDSATAIYHAFVVGAYGWPLLGASLADGSLGRYKVILYFSIIYCIGMLVQSFSALPFLSPADANFKTTNAIICILALFLIGLGTGGIKPCVSTLGGDQFDDDDEKGREFFFNMFYISINIGSLISEFITPKIRGISCGSLGWGDNCYFIAFLIPACLMVVALIVFVAGTKWYIVRPPSGDNVFWLHLKTIHYGLWSKGDGTEQHWLERAKGKVPDWIIRDMKYFIPMLYVLLPQPLYWCCYDQSGSRWVLQGLKLDGWIGDSVLVLADQVPILNGAMIIIFVPLFAWLYGVVDRCFGFKICTELRKWSAGYIFLSAAFVVSAILQSQIMSEITTYPAYDEEMSLRVLNLSSEMVSGKFMAYGEAELDKDEKLEQEFTIYPGQVTEILDLEAAEENNANEGVSYLKTNELLVDTVLSDSAFSFKYATYESFFNVTYGRINWNLVLLPEGNSISYPGWAEKNENGKNFITIVNGRKDEIFVELECSETDQPNSNCQAGNFTVPACTNYQEVNADNALAECVYGEKFDEEHLSLLIKGFYNIKIDGELQKDQNGEILELEVRTGAAYTLVAYNNAQNQPSSNLITDIKMNTLPMAAIIPQWFLLTVAEVLFTTTGYIFCYEQIPPGLKSVVQAYLLVCCAVGNIFVIIVAESKLFPTQTIEFLFFAGVLIVALILHGFLSWNYEYVDNSLFTTFDYPSDKKNEEDLDQKGIENHAADKEHDL